MSANDGISQEDYPEWMKQAQRPLDWGALIILGFCLIAGFSFITQAELPAYNDTEHYAYQIANYAEAFADGIIYNRWSPYVISGYGAAIPHYYPSGAAYIGGLISYLFTNNALVATKILYVFSFILAGSMTYNFVKLNSSALSAMLASILYIFSPFVMITIPHIEGNLALSLGIGLLPSLLWAVSRYLKRNQAFDATLIALIVGIIIFTIPSILIQAFIASLVLIAIEFQQGLKPKQIFFCISAILLGILLASFYWLPALVQTNSIEWYPALIEAPRYQLLWDDLFKPSQVIDSGLLKPLPTYNLGLGLLLIMPLSLISLILKKDMNLFYLGFFSLGLITLGCILFFAPQQTSYLALVILSFSISASYHGHIILGNKHLQFIAVTVSVVIILLSSMPAWLIPQPSITINTTNRSAQINYERLGFGYAGLPVGFALPSRLSPDDASLRPQNINTSRFLPNLEANINSIEETPYTTTLNIRTDIALDIEYQRAYFPNWQVLDSTGRLSITESDNNLLMLNIPADIDTSASIRFGMSIITGLAWVISIGGVGLCGFTWWYRWRTTAGDYDTSVLLSQGMVQIFVLILFIFLILRIGAPSIPSNLLSKEAQYTMSDSLFVQTNFDNNFQLFAYNNPTGTYQADDTIRIRVFWQIDNESNAHYLVQLRLTDRNRQESFYETGYSHAGYFPSNRWQPANIVAQDFIFDLPRGESEYFIIFDVYKCQTACSVNIMTEQEANGQIPVLRPIIME